MVQTKDVCISIEEIIKSIVGNITQVQFIDFINKSWKAGNFLYRIDNCFHPNLCLINSLDKDEKFLTESFHLPHQVPSTSTLVYKKGLHARLVHDSFNDKGSVSTRFDQFNIEPHYHIVDSLIIVTSEHKENPGKFFLWDN